MSSFLHSQLEASQGDMADSQGHRGRFDAKRRARRSHTVGFERPKSLADLMGMDASGLARNGEHSQLPVADMAQVQQVQRNEVPMTTHNTQEAGWNNRFSDLKETFKPLSASQIPHQDERHPLPNTSRVKQFSEKWENNAEHQKYNAQPLKPSRGQVKWPPCSESETRFNPGVQKSSSTTACFLSKNLASSVAPPSEAITKKVEQMMKQVSEVKAHASSLLFPRHGVPHVQQRYQPSSSGSDTDQSVNAIPKYQSPFGNRPYPAINTVGMGVPNQEGGGMRRVSSQPVLQPMPFQPITRERVGYPAASAQSPVYDLPATSRKPAPQLQQPMVVNQPTSTTSFAEIQKPRVQAQAFEIAPSKKPASQSPPQFRQPVAVHRSTSTQGFSEMQSKATFESYEPITKKAPQSPPQMKQPVAVNQGLQGVQQQKVPAESFELAVARKPAPQSPTQVRQPPIIKHMPSPPSTPVVQQRGQREAPSQTQGQLPSHPQKIREPPAVENRPVMQPVSDDHGCLEMPPAVVKVAGQDKRFTGAVSQKYIESKNPVASKVISGKLQLSMRDLSPKRQPRAQSLDPHQSPRLPSSESKHPRENDVLAPANLPRPQQTLQVPQVEKERSRSKSPRPILGRPFEASMDARTAEEKQKTVMAFFASDSAIVDASKALPSKVLPKSAKEAHQQIKPRTRTLARQDTIEQEFDALADTVVAGGVTEAELFGTEVFGNPSSSLNVMSKSSRNPMTKCRSLDSSSSKSLSNAPTGPEGSVPPPGIYDLSAAYAQYSEYREKGSDVQELVCALQHAHMFLT